MVWYIKLRPIWENEKYVEWTENDILVNLVEITSHDFAENMETGSTTSLRTCIMQILDKLEDLFDFFFFFCGESYNSLAILFFYYLLSNSYLKSKGK